MSLDHLSFGSPQYLFALVAVPLFAAFVVALRRRRSRTAVSFTNLEMFAHVRARRRFGWGRRLPLILLGLMLATSATALARPRVQLGVTDQGATIVLLVDVSSSMQATDVYPTRIDAAVKAMREFLAQLPANDRVGLVTLSDTADVIDDPTTDRGAIESGLDALSPHGETALGEGVQAAVNLAVSSLAANGVQTESGQRAPAAIVLESDGAQNRGSVSTNAAAEIAKSAGVRIYGVALGTLNGYVQQGRGFGAFKIAVPPDRETVALLARETGGQAFNAGNAKSLDSIYRGLGSSIERQHKSVEITSWLDVASAVLLASAVGLGLARGPALP